MKPNLRVLLVILLLFLLSKGYSQQNYYWSGDKKNFLNVDSTRVLVYAKGVSDLSRLRSKFLLQKEVISITDLSGGDKQSLDIKIERASYKKFKNDVSKFSELEFIVPYYSIDTKPFYLTNEVVLKPRKNISVDQIINLTGGILSIKEKTQYNTYLLELNT